MLENINVNNILFLDIETVPAYPDYAGLPYTLRHLWDKKAMKLLQRTNQNTNEVKSEITPDDLYERAGIYSEFGKIICISTCIIRPAKPGGNREFRVKSFYDHDEKKILREFAELLTLHYSKPVHLLCAHNGKEFDFPYIARRMLINRIQLPEILNIAGRKPWEINHLDTMELWKFGDHKNYTSLELLAEVFHLPAPKSNMGGSDVARIYWKENNLEKIADYCQKDVLAVAQLLLSFKAESWVDEMEIVLPH